MRIARITLVVLTLGAVLRDPAAATSCAASYFGGLCWDGEISYACGPTEAGCVPNSGFLLFNSASPEYVYWTFEVRRSNVPGRFNGRLKVATEEGAKELPVPGFFGRCRDGLCYGRSARVRGTVEGERFSALARYYGGARCEFRGTIRFGLGDLEPNTFICHDAAGQVVGEGIFRVQGMRLTCCEP